VVEDFTGVPLPTDPTNTYTTADANRQGVNTLKTNGKGGYVRGFELTHPSRSRCFAEPLDGFGVILSGTKNSSSLIINGAQTPIPGLSPRSSTRPSTTRSTASPLASAIATATTSWVKCRSSMPR
jgi:iron complex outermembrane receptor protein